MFTWYRKWYANMVGAAWLTCPLCKEGFGGHEVTGDNAIILNEKEAGFVCPKPLCLALAKKQNDDFAKNAPRKRWEGYPAIESANPQETILPAGVPSYAFIINFRWDEAMGRYYVIYEWLDLPVIDWTKLNKENHNVGN
jgi:hypothetical protein